MFLSASKDIVTHRGSTSAKDTQLPWGARIRYFAGLSHIIDPRPYEGSVSAKC